MIGGLSKGIGHNLVDYYRFPPAIGISVKQTESERERESERASERETERERD